jgi:hypothetical protein
MFRLSSTEGALARTGSYEQRRLWDWSKGVGLGAVSIPRKSGGERILGVSTVADSVAQMVVKQSLSNVPRNKMPTRPNDAIHSQGTTANETFLK